MNRKKQAALDISLCAAGIAIHVILEVLLTIRIGNDLKISLAALPFLVLAFVCGPWHGLISGLVGTFLSQLMTFGITITTPFWILPYAVQAMTAGLIFRAFRRKADILPVAVSVSAGGLAAVILNLVASYFDGVVFFKYWTVEVLLGLIPFRLLVWVGLSVLYTIILCPVTRVLQKTFSKPAIRS